jgi:hypothetical protein
MCGHIRGGPTPVLSHVQVFSRFSGLLHARSSGTVTLQRLSREGMAWAPCVGNLCTVIAFLMALALNEYVTGEGFMKFRVQKVVCIRLSGPPFFCRWWP